MIDNHIPYRLLLLAFIVLMNAFFASAEAALISVRRSRLAQLVEEGHAGAQSALNLLSHPERLLSTVQVGVTLASLGAGWAGEETIYRIMVHWFPSPASPWLTTVVNVLSLGLSFLVLTYAMVVLGEVVPKNLAIRRADRYAVVVAPILLFFSRIAGPFVFLLERSSAAVSRLLGASDASTATHSAEELRLIASSVTGSGQISSFEEHAIHRILDLPDLAVREVMVPRNDIVSVPVDASLDYLLRTMTEHQYSRVPVYEGKPEQVIGILHYKDLLPVWERHRVALRMQSDPPPFRLRTWLRKHSIVPESKPVSQMIDEFRLGHNHMAMVVDEFGTIVGLVTFEDVIEQVFGEIEDEHDVRRPRPSLQATVLELEGTISIRDLEMQYGIELPTNAGFETLAGFILYRLGYIPQPGERLEHEGRRFTILEMDHNRIASVRIEKITETEQAMRQE
jgi:CBS domain containing-hemolysin-like protein